MKDREGGEKGNWGKETLLVSKKRGLGYTENGRLNEKGGGSQFVRYMVAR